MQTSTIKKISAITGVFGVIIAIVVISFNFSKQDHAPAVNLNAPASLTLVSPTSLTASVGDTQSIHWVSDNYGPKTVSVNILRKVSDNPARYEVVRTVASATKNDGSAVWVPAKTDVNGETLIQVGCAESDQACTAAISPSTFAVVDDGRNSNTASAYAAIEAAFNK